MHLRRRIPIGVALLLAALAQPGVGTAAPAPPEPRPGAPALAAPAPGAAGPVADGWIVELDAAPLARYDGGLPGLPATAPAAPGERVALDDAAAREYERHLDGQEEAALRAAGPGVRADVRYRTAFAGFAARLTGEQVARLRDAPGVRRVTRERVLRLHESTLPAGGGPGGEAELLGLPRGLWRRLGGPSRAGAGIVVGVVDTGVTPGAPSFSGAGLEPPAGFQGECEAGEGFPADACNAKLVGARSFLEGAYGGSPPEGVSRSPRDDDGHGTHVASLAVGAAVDPDIAGNGLGVGRISGVAPGAHLAAYKACTAYGCSDVDVIAAVDAAVRDGVDVLNLSLGGPLDPAGPVDPVQVALLGADAAGILVVTSAGNLGDLPGAIGSPGAAPWTTTVAATTSRRTFRTTMEVAGADGARAQVAASTVGPALGDAPLVDARDLGPRQSNPIRDPRHCVEGLLPQRVRGAAVICDAFAPLEVVLPALREAGASALVLAVSGPAEDPAISAELPTLVVEADGARALRAVTSRGAATVRWAAGRATPWLPDRLAAFSSRGPVPGVPDLLRPDVAAPGVNVLGAFAPGTASGDRFAALSGTSMASPHVAGVAALLRQLHGDWSPAALRSALVTTAAPVVDADGAGAAPRMGQGAGRIDPQSAADPGLVVEPTQEDYRRWAEGLDPAAVEGDLPPLEGRDLELPSLAVDELTRPVEVVRTVRNVSGARARWTATVQGRRRGLDVRVRPRRFVLAAGARRRVRITVAGAAGAPAHQDAAVVLRRADGREARLPVAVRNPGVVDAPPLVEVATAAADGTRTLDVTVSGEVSAVGHGLAAPRVDLGLVADRLELEGVWGWTRTIDVPEGAALLSARVSPAAADGQVFVDLWRDADGDGRLSAGDVPAAPWSPDPADERAALPRAGRHFVNVVAFGEQPPRFDLRTWLVADPRPDDPSPAPGLWVDLDPQAAFPAQPRAFALRWSGAGGGEPLRGVVTWHEGAAGEDDVLATSQVEVTPAR